MSFKNKSCSIDVIPIFIYKYISPLLSQIVSTSHSLRLQLTHTELTPWDLTLWVACEVTVNSHHEVTQKPCCDLIVWGHNYNSNRAHTMRPHTVSCLWDNNYLTPWDNTNTMLWSHSLRSQLTHTKLTQWDFTLWVACEVTIISHHEVTQKPYCDLIVWGHN